MSSENIRLLQCSHLLNIKLKAFLPEKKYLRKKARLHLVLASINRLPW